MYSATIIIMGLLPTLLLFATARLEGVGGAGPSPMRVMGWTLLLGFTLKSLYLSYAVRSGAPFVGEWLAFDLIDRGQLLILGSVIFMVSGYLLASTALADSRVQYRRFRPLKFDFAPVYWAFFGFSLLLMVAFFHKMDFADQLTSLRFIAVKKFVADSGVASSLGFLTIGGDFLAIICVLRLVFGPRVRLWDPHVLAMLFITLCYMLSSRRNGVVIFIILYLIASVFVSTRKASGAGLTAGKATKPTLSVKRSKLKRLSIVGVILVSLSFVGQIRSSAGQESDLSDLDVVGAVETTFQQVFKGAYLLDPAKSAAIASHTFRNDAFLYGESFYAVFFTPIPRILWPEKPNVRIGPYVGQEILKLNNRSGAPPGGFAELYMNFGTLGVIAGSVAVGALLAFAWQQARNTSSILIGGTRYTIAVTAILIFISTDFAAAFLVYVKYRMGAAIALRYLMGMEARAERRGQAPGSDADLPARPIGAGLV